MKSKTSSNYASFKKLLNFIKDQNFEYETVQVNLLEAGKYYLSSDDVSFDNFNYAISVLQEASKIFKKGSNFTDDDYSRLHEIHSIIFENYNVTEAIEMIQDDAEWEASELKYIDSFPKAKD